MSKIRVSMADWATFLAALLLAGIQPATAATPLARFAPAWKPVSPAELALSAPVVEPNADVEAIFWDVRIEDSLDVTGDPRTDTWNHVRVKVFTPRGKESWTRIDIASEGRRRIADLAARTIRKDGSIVEAGADAVSERTLVKAGGLKVKASSVAVPGVEVGSLIEYRWREIQPDRVSFATHLTVERSIPIQTATFAFKPLDSGDYRMETHAFGVQPAPFVRDRDGFSVTSVTNVHPVIEEPMAPPSDTYRAWILVTYSRQKPGTSPDDYWRALGRRMADLYKPVVSPPSDVRAAASAAIGSETDPEKKLVRLFDYCRTKIRNADAPGSKVTREEWDRLIKDDSPSATLSRQLATPAGIDIAFAALATAAGFESRIARAGDRSTFFFDPNQMSPYFLDRLAAAVKVGDNWRFFSPGTPSVGFGQVPWQIEDQVVLICDPKEPRFVRIPATPADKTTIRRRAQFRLDAAGTISGTVRLEMTGQAAIERRAALGNASPKEVEAAVREDVTDRFPGADVSAVTVEERDAPEKPLVITYAVEAPAFATRTATYLLLPASWFRKGQAPRFPSPTRTQPVFFHYGTTEEDEISVEIPERFAVEDTSTPPPVRILGGKGEYKVALTQDGRTVTYRRSFRLTGGTVGVEDFPPLKRAFDRIQSADEQTITLASTP